MIYLFALIIILIPVFRFDLMKLEGNRSLWFISELIILILISGLRYRVGGDTLIYMDFFEDYPTLAELSDFDFTTALYNPLWYIYNAVFKSCGDSFTLFQIVQAIIVNVAFFRFFKRYTRFYFSAILVYYIGYYFYFNMEVLREALCISLFLTAYPFLEKKKFVPYILICIVAMFIHTFSAFLLLLPFAHFVKRESVFLALALVVSAVVLIKVVDIISIMLNLAFEGQAAETIKVYLEKQAPNMIGATIQFLICLPFIMIMWVRRHLDYDEDRFMGVLLLAVIMIQSIGMFVPAFPRFANYILPFGIIYIVNTFYIHYWDIRTHPLSSLVMAGALFIYAFNLSYFYLKNKDEDLKGAHVYNRYLPYHSVLNPKSDRTREQLLLNERAEFNPFN